MAVNTITLGLDDGTEITVIMVSDIDAPLHDLLASGDQLRLRADDLDVSGHASSNVLPVWIAGPDDVIGHPLALRLPDAESAREFQLKLIGGGAFAVVLNRGRAVGPTPGQPLSP